MNEHAYCLSPVARHVRNAVAMGAHADGRQVSPHALGPMVPQAGTQRKVMAAVLPGGSHVNDAVEKGARTHAEGRRAAGHAVGLFFS